MTRMERITDNILKDFDPVYEAAIGQVQSPLYTEDQCKAMIKAAFRSALWKTWMALDDPVPTPPPWDGVESKLYIEGGEVHEVQGDKPNPRIEAPPMDYLTHGESKGPHEVPGEQ